MLGGKKLRSILLLLFSHLHVGPSDLFPSSFKLKLYALSSLPACYMSYPSTLTDFLTIIVLCDQYKDSLTSCLLSPYSL